MANKRVKMERAARAKQFLPFDALKGFREALKEQERILAARRELSPEEKEELDQKLRTIRKKDVVMVEFFQNGQNTKITGMVTEKDETGRVLEVAQVRIAFDDISGLWLQQAQG